MKFILNKDKVTLEGYFDTNVSGTINYYEIPIEYDETWENLVIKAIIVNKEEDAAEEISVINDKFFIDKENSGTYRVGFVGYTIENDEKIYQISTDLISFIIDKGAGEIEGVESHDIPTPSEWEIYIAQIQEMIDSIGTEINYNNLQNKPQINDVTLQGNKSLQDLGIQPEGDYALRSELPTALSELSEDSTHRVVTDVEKTTWNNKANTSDIPTKTSDLNNNSGFITNAVNDLLNYYLKSEVFTKQEVNDLISAITTLDLQVVQTLPTQDISTTTIYLVPKTTAQTNNAYDEYIYVSNAWEFIGSTEVDLTNYVTNTDYATSSKGGVFKTHTNYATDMANGFLVALPKTYSQYVELQNYAIISKGTLENVLTEKIGTIETILETLDIGSGV